MYVEELSCVAWGIGTRRGEITNLSNLLENLELGQKMLRVLHSHFVSYISIKGRPSVYIMLSSCPPPKRLKTALKCSNEPSTSPPTSTRDSMLSWLRSHDVEHGNGNPLPWLDNLDFRPSVDGSGEGIFAKNDIDINDVVVSVPITACITPQVAIDSPVGVAFKALFPSVSPLTSEISFTTPGCDIQSPSHWTYESLLIWLYISTGLTDTTNPHHLYIKSLPSQTPEVSTWPPKHTQLLTGTSLHTTLQTEILFFQSLLKSYLPTLKSHPIFSSLNPSKLLWSKSMYTSRRYPLTLLSLTSPSFEGCLIPVADLFNHCNRSKIMWGGGNGMVEFKSGEKVREGEVRNI